MDSNKRSNSTNLNLKNNSLILVDNDRVGSFNEFIQGFIITFIGIASINVLFKRNF